MNTEHTLTIGPMAVADGADGAVWLARTIWDHPVFHTAREASVFVVGLALLAEPRTTVLPTRFGPCRLSGGEVLVNVSELARRFRLPRREIQRLLQRMELADLVTIDRCRITQRAGVVVSVVSYIAADDDSDAAQLARSLCAVREPDEDHG